MGLRKVLTTSVYLEIEVPKPLRSLPVGRQEGQSSKTVLAHRKRKVRRNLCRRNCPPSEIKRFDFCLPPREGGGGGGGGGKPPPH